MAAPVHRIAGTAFFFLALISYNFVDIDIWHQMALIRASLRAGTSAACGLVRLHADHRTVDRSRMGRRRDRIFRDAVARADARC